MPVSRLNVKLFPLPLRVSKVCDAVNVNAALHGRVYRVAGNINTIVDQSIIQQEFLEGIMDFDVDPFTTHESTMASILYGPKISLKGIVRADTADTELIAVLNILAGSATISNVSSNGYIKIEYKIE